MNIQTGAGDCTVYFDWLTLPSLAHHSSVTSLKAWCLSLWGCLFRCGQPGHTVACLGLTNEIRRWQWHGVEAKWSPKPQAGAGKGMFWAMLMSHRGPVCSPELLLCSPVCFCWNQLLAGSEYQEVRRKELIRLISPISREKRLLTYQEVEGEFYCLKGKGFSHTTARLQLDFQFAFSSLKRSKSRFPPSSPVWIGSC